MSFIGSMLGAGQGSSYVAPSTATAGMSNPTNDQQMGNAYGSAQAALAQQQAFANAAAGQNGLANQSSVYNQLQGVANGTGPNPAAAQLAQATGANTANTAALMAGQRGAGANVGLMARQAGQQGAMNQQNAAGQAATMQANQSLGALGQMGSLAGQQVSNQAGAIGGLNQAQQSEQQNLLGAQGQYNGNLANLAGNQNTTNSGIQVQNSKAQQGIFGGLLGGAGSMLAKGGEVEAPAMASGGGFLYGSAPSSQSQQPAAPSSPIIIDNSGGGIQGGTSSLVSKGLQHLASNFGGPNTSPLTQGMNLSQPNLGDGVFGSPNATLGANTGLGGAGAAPDLSPDFSSIDLSLQPTATGAFGDSAAADAGTGAAAAGAADAGAAAEGSGAASDVAALLAKGGMAKPPMKPMPAGKPHNLKAGGGVPGKPKIPGAKDTLKNDTVPAVLTPGEIVIPRSVTQAPNAPKEAAKFVAAIMMRKGGGHPLRGMAK